MGLSMTPAAGAGNRGLPTSLRLGIHADAVKIATWNVNSLRAREDLVLDWLEREDPDVLCMQETKLTDQEFPEDPFGDLDYDVEFFGQRAYNGVAIAAHEPLNEVQKGFAGDDKKSEKRLIAATIEDIRVVDIYLPNGQSLDSDKFPYKLGWMDNLAAFLEETCDPSQPLILTGDFNLCPTALDGHPDISRPGDIFFSDEERGRYQRLLDWGLTDAFRHLYPDQEKAFTWWDYRAGGWERDRGLRIDHFLVTAPVLERVKDVIIHRSMRAEESPSDHVPVMLELED